MKSLLVIGASSFALAVAFAVGVPAQAAEAVAAGAPSPDEGATIQEVVVTAQKRETTVQKTAAAVTVLDSKVLQKQGLNSIADISTLAPAVSFTQNSANVIVSIRGVSSRDTTEIGDPAVAISTDGFAILRPTGFLGALYDLERVEVLRGPQGTLYGRSATGGAINFITAKPVNDMAARVSATAGNFGLLKFEGMANIPLTDDLASRVSFYSSRHNGYRTGESPARAGDDDDTTSGRIHLLYKPTDRLQVLLTAQYTHLGGVGPTVQGIPIVGATNVNVQPDVPERGTPHGLPNQWIDLSVAQYQINVNYDLGFANLIYLGGYRDMDYKQLRDLDGDVPSNNYFNPSEHPKDVSHEIRLVSHDSGKLKWQLGGYYFDEDNKLVTYYQTFAVANPPTNIFTFDYGVKTRSYAAFGQGSYEIIDGLSLEGGLRYSNDFKRRDGFQNTGHGDIPLPGEITSTKLTYEAGVNWQATPVNLLYAKVSTGYKAGGFSTIFVGGLQAGATVQQISYAPETVRAIEIGSKNQFFGRRLQVNLAAYTYKYQNQQVGVSQGGTSYIANAGQSQLRGFELESIARPTARDQFDGSIAYLDAAFTKFCATATAAGACTVDFAGHKPVGAPKWQVNAGYEHGFDAFGGTLTPRGQLHYESGSYLGVENFVLGKQDAYVRVDAMLTYLSPDAKWSLQAFARNLNDAKVLTSAGTGFGHYLFALAPPRTFGVQFTSNW